MKKILTPEQLEKRKKLNKKIIIFIILPVVLLWVVILNIPTNQSFQEGVKINIDSICKVIMKDSVYEIKDVFYNKIDSTLNIAFVYKKGDLYSTNYFDQTYHIDSFPCFDGLKLYSYKKGLSLAKNEYKNVLTYNSRKLGIIEEKFEKKYYSSYLGTYKPLYEYLKENLDNPSSLEVLKSFFIGMNADSTFGVKATFRAKNAFGALMMHTVNCNIDKNGEISNVELDK